MRNIYLCHQYLVKEHFLALYCGGIGEDFCIKNYIILSNKNIVYNFFYDLKNKPIYKCVYELCVRVIAKIKFHFLSNEIMVVGIAPYDYRLNRYEKIFRKNKCIYFSSYQHWDDVDEDRLCLPETFNNKERFKRILKETMKCSACVTNETAIRVRKIIDNCEIVGHSIETDKYKKKDINHLNRNKFIFLGVLSDRKNIPLILKWLKKNPDIKLSITFVGSGKYENEIRNRGLHDGRITHIPWMNKEQIQKSLCEYDFLLLPSKDEPFGIVLLEALASGVICITSNAIGPSEIIKENVDGFIFDLNDEFNSFSDVMNKALQLNDIQYKTMIGNCMTEANEFSPKFVIKKWEKLINDVLL